MDKVKGQFTKRSELKGPDSYEAWKRDPSDANLDAVMKAISPAINSGINAHAGGDRSFRTKARVLAFQSLSTFDPTKGGSLNTHVYNSLRRLNRIKGQRQNAVRIPEGLHFDRNAIEDFSKKYLDKNGIEPSDLRISDSLNMSMARINRARSRELPSSRALSDKGDQAGTDARSESSIWTDYVYFDLDERDKKIFEWTTGYGGAEKISKKDIAQKLGISQPAVSQRVSKIVAKLEEVKQ